MRGKLEVDTLVRLVLLLVVIWLILGIVEELVQTFSYILGPVSNLVGLIVLVLLVLWLLDRL